MSEKTTEIITEAITALIVTFINSFFVMVLWNGIATDLFELPHLDYIQALGLVVLIRFLFPHSIE